MRRGISGLIVIKISVVVITLGVLVAIVTPNIVTNDNFDDPIVLAHAHIRAIDSALTFYRLDNSHYPTNEQGLAALVQRPDDPNLGNWRVGGYLPLLPKGPWGNDYLYANPGQNGEVDIYTLGRDGRPGGKGPDTIGNWNLRD